MNDTIATPHKVSFECSDNAAWLFVEMLEQLKALGSDGLTRSIRIGGKEYTFEGDGEDKIDSFNINGVSDLSDLQKHFQTLRKKMVKKIAKKKPDSVVLTPGGYAKDSNNAANLSLLSDEVVDAIESIVLEWTDKEKMFTAFDVTKEAKSQGIQENHHALKTVVHKMFLNNEMPDYTRQLIEIDGDSAKPFLYFPVNSNPDDYSPPDEP